MSAYQLSTARVCVHRWLFSVFGSGHSLGFTATLCIEQRRDSRMDDEHLHSLQRRARLLLAPLQEKSRFPPNAFLLRKVRYVLRLGLADARYGGDIAFASRRCIALICRGIAGRVRESEHFSCSMLVQVTGLLSSVH